MCDIDSDCQICLEVYDTTLKIPKKLECCGAVYCQRCLDDIYKKNGSILCPICRVKANKLPKDLKVAKEHLEKYLICPSCKSNVKNHELKLNIVDMTPTIICSKCADYPDLDDLKNYTTNLLFEMTYFKEAFCNIDRNEVEQNIESLIKEKVDSTFDKFKETCIIFLKEKIIKIFEEKVIYSKMESLFEDIDNYNKSLKGLSEIEEIKGKDYLTIIQSVNFYINSSDWIKERSRELLHLKSDLSKDLIQFNVDDIEKNIFSKVSLHFNQKRFDVYEEYTPLSNNKFTVSSNRIEILSNQLVKSDSNDINSFSIYQKSMIDI
jgi:hypothetical protein